MKKLHNYLEKRDDKFLIIENTFKSIIKSRDDSYLI